MPLIYVTGAPGSGKSTALQKLRDQGYQAFGTDEHDFSQWVDRKTGKVAVPPITFDAHEWYLEHEWALNPESVTELKGRADQSGSKAYLFGVAAGTEAVWHCFDRVVVLTAEKEALRQRILTRTNSSFGKVPNELNIILSWQDLHVRDYQGQGAIVIDTTDLTPEAVASAILAVTRDTQDAAKQENHPY